MKEVRRTPAGGADPDRVRLALEVLGPEAGVNKPLGAHTTYRVGGSAAIFFTIRRDADLASVAEAKGQSGMPVLVVGRGSNLLVSERGFGGIAIRLDSSPSRYGAVDLGQRTVTAGGAAALPAVARRAADAGLRGIEWSVGVPGSVGGGVRMNAGGHGSDMATVIVSARVADLAGSSGTAAPVVATLGPDELQHRYRSSSIRADQVVIEATLAVSPGEAVEARRTIVEIVHWRREHQPGGQNAGSVFANPPEGSAGRFIEEAGLKGFRVGTATVSPKHANFIQADRDGSADDVRALMEEVRATVAGRTGVVLESEVRLIGFGQGPGDRSQADVEGER